MNPYSRLLFYPILFLLLFLSAYCGPNIPKLTEFFLQQNPHQGGLMKADELKVMDITPGTGTELLSASKIKVNYKSWIFSVDHQENKGPLVQEATAFEASWGEGHLIEAWETGLKGLKVGGKRQLTIPASLAYGDAGSGEKIPPGTKLITEVELLNLEVTSPAPSITAPKSSPQ